MNTKTLFGMSCLLAVMLMGVMKATAAEKINTDPKQQLPDPDIKPAAADKPVQVFILLGQSNMLGFGEVDPEEKKGTLQYLIKQAGKYPEFNGNVKTVEARDFWRDKSVSPTGAGYHYNHNAETHVEVGNALGWAMAELMQKKGAN